MGVITLALIMAGWQSADQADPHLWVIIACACAIALGTYMGGWRIIRTLARASPMCSRRRVLGRDLDRRDDPRPSALGFALSTTQVASGSVIGSGLAAWLDRAMGHRRAHRRGMGADSSGVRRRGRVRRAAGGLVRQLGHPHRRDPRASSSSPSSCARAEPLVDSSNAMSEVADSGSRSRFRARPRRPVVSARSSAKRRAEGRGEGAREGRTQEGGCRVESPRQSREHRREEGAAAMSIEIDWFAFVRCSPPRSSGAAGGRVLTRWACACSAGGARPRRRTGGVHRRDHRDQREGRAPAAKAAEKAARKARSPTGRSGGCRRLRPFALCAVAVLAGLCPHRHEVSATPR